MKTINNRIAKSIQILITTFSFVCCVGINAEDKNIAVNPSRNGFPNPLQSDGGWAGGSDQWEIVDGNRTYSEWYHGLAFTGGSGYYGGSPCGVRQVTIDFGENKTFNKVIIWHHAHEHIPETANLSYWDGINWIDISFQRIIGATEAGGAGSTSDEYNFTPVTGSKVKWSLNNCLNNILGNQITHGWIYEVEVFEYTPPLIEITSLTTNGRLTFTNSVNNGLFTVEWAASPLTNWNDSWSSLKDFIAMGNNVTIDIPISYRVKCITNLQWILPQGASRLERGSNYVGEVFTNCYTVSGNVFLQSKGNEYKIIELTSTRSTSNPSLVACRSTDKAIYDIVMYCGEEEMAFTNAAVGTSWTNITCGLVYTATIEAQEQVSVPAGTFQCFKVFKRAQNVDHNYPVWIEWYSPGFGLIKWVDYFTDENEYPPIYYELISLTANPK